MESEPVHTVPKKSKKVKIKAGTNVIRKNEDPTEIFTDGIVHKVIRDQGKITHVQVSFYSKIHPGFQNRTMRIETLEIV